MGAVPGPTHQAEPRACLLVQSPQPLTTGPQRIPQKRPQFQNSHCRAMVREAQEVARQVGPGRSPRQCHFLFCKAQGSSSRLPGGGWCVFSCSVPPTNLCSPLQGVCPVITGLYKPGHSLKLAQGACSSCQRWWPGSGFPCIVSPTESPQGLAQSSILSRARRGGHS